MSPRRGLHLRELDTIPLDVFPGDIGYTTGQYYVGIIQDAAPTNQSSIDDNLRASAIYITRNVTIDRIGVQVQVAQATASTRFGIYESGADGLPSKLLIDAGTIDSSTTGFKEITVNQALRGPRIYWGAYVHSIDNVELRSRGVMPSLGFGSGGGTNPNNSVTVSHTFGVLPDPYGTSTITTIDGNALYMRVL